ncbi:MAG: FtsX-like permease family protein [Thermoguttaceae bacterium]|nr:FtsX-like permease family protein [Thermoguttaceae bacterium]MDW8037448.1 FtsX-like permease family protein [Thermoguttaceae bacterium]
MKLFLLVLKNIRRNWLRSVLTGLGTIVLVVVVIMVWSILWYLDEQTREKTSNIKAIVTERWQMPSRMPLSYAPELCAGAARRPEHVRPLDNMTWQFYVGSTEPGRLSRESALFIVATQPEKVLTMFEELDTLPPDSSERRQLEKAIQAMRTNRQALIVGRERLQAINKRVGERVKVYGMSFKGIDLEFDIVGTFPEGRWNNLSVMDWQYLNGAVDAYNRRPGNRPHPMTERSLAIVWLKVPDMRSFTAVASQIATSPSFSNPQVKTETLASGTAAFLEAFRDLIWGMRYFLMPAAVITLCLVIANAISLSVRERRKEFAVLKVLGFRPGHILALVLGEALILGVVSGLLSAAGIFWLINGVFGGLKFPIGFFGTFYIPVRSLGWGVAVGASTALIGSLVPAWIACRVRVAEIFARVG